MWLYLGKQFRSRKSTVTNDDGTVKCRVEGLELTVKEDLELMNLFNRTPEANLGFDLCCHIYKALRGTCTSVPWKWSEDDDAVASLELPSGKVEITASRIFYLQMGRDIQTENNFRQRVQSDVIHLTTAPPKAIPPTQGTT
jgi:hypothetical protein